MDKAIIVDLDGTLCDCEHRVHHVHKEEKDWKSFNDGMVNDDLNVWCAKLIEAMNGNGFKTIFVTGRDENYRTHTEDWLSKHQINYHHLHMRPVMDYRGDDEIKKEIYDNDIKDKFDVLFVVDDRLSVVKMWRSIGLVCLQCDWGDF
jgi:FMN phosphatase YigB (HAD superfamily)